jgi:hypothetical protein
MQSLDDNGSDEEKMEKLDQDYERPFSEPTDIPGQGKIQRDDPSLDTDVDEDEWYSEGRAAASGSDASEQSGKQKT